MGLAVVDRFGQLAPTLLVVFTFLATLTSRLPITEAQGLALPAWQQYLVSSTITNVSLNTVVGSTISQDQSRLLILVKQNGATICGAGFSNCYAVASASMNASGYYQPEVGYYVLGNVPVAGADSNVEDTASMCINNDGTRAFIGGIGLIYPPGTTQQFVAFYLERSAINTSWGLVQAFTSNATDFALRSCPTNSTATVFAADMVCSANLNTVAFYDRTRETSITMTNGCKSIMTVYSYQSGDGGGSSYSLNYLKLFPGDNITPTTTITAPVARQSKYMQLSGDETRLFVLDYPGGTIYVHNFLTGDALQDPFTMNLSVPSSYIYYLASDYRGRRLGIVSVGPLGAANDSTIKTWQFDYTTSIYSQTTAFNVILNTSLHLNYQGGSTLLFCHSGRFFYIGVTKGPNFAATDRIVIRYESPSLDDNTFVQSSPLYNVEGFASVGVGGLVPRHHDLNMLTPDGTQLYCRAGILTSVLFFRNITINAGGSDASAAECLITPAELPTWPPPSLPSPSVPPPSNNRNGQLTPGAAVGIAVGAGVLFSLVVIVCSASYDYFNRTKKRTAKRK